MTNDGALIDAMMRGANGHEKEYIVRVRSRISDGELHRLEKGMYLRELNQQTKPCTVERLGDRTFRIVLTQGLNRQIRRMCQACGYQVKTLKRVRVMNILLGDLKPGEYREIGEAELKQLYGDCRMKF
jgi:23S rRNA pseudouridine2604 synthase